MVNFIIKKIKTTTPSGKWFSAEVEGVQVINGKVELTLTNKKYQHYHIKLCDCIVVKYSINDAPHA